MPGNRKAFSTPPDPRSQFFSQNASHKISTLENPCPLLKLSLASLKIEEKLEKNAIWQILKPNMALNFAQGIEFAISIVILVAYPLRFPH
jgi:hypothetical protein